MLQDAETHRYQPVTAGSTDLHPGTCVLGETAGERRLSAAALLAVPTAAGIALAIHLLVARNQVAGENRTYTICLSFFFAVALVLALIQYCWPALRARLGRLRPIFTVGVLLLSVWELITSGFHLLPLPYFPSPAAVLQSIISDRALLFDSTWHSLALLLGGYGLLLEFTGDIAD